MNGGMGPPAHLSSRFVQRPRHALATPLPPNSAAQTLSSGSRFNDTGFHAMNLHKALPEFTGLSAANRPIRLRLFDEHGVSDDTLLVTHVSGSESMCRGLDYTLLCVSTQAGMRLKQFIANPVEVQFVTDSGGMRCVRGIAGNLRCSTTNRKRPSCAACGNGAVSRDLSWPASPCKAAQTRPWPTPWSCSMTPNRWRKTRPNWPPASDEN